MELEVLPLFSSPVGIIQIEEDFSSMKNYVSKLDFLDSGTYKFFYSDNRKILESFPREKEIIMSYFNSYKDEILNLGPTKFSITTSWITKTERGGYSHNHRHSNSVYSGIFYFDDSADGDGGELEINRDFSIPTFELNCGPNPNIYNTNSIQLKPRKNMLVIFPSNLQHQVFENTSNRNRYSLAFNLFPVGPLNDLDSFINLSVS